MRELLAIATKNLLQRYPRQGVGINDNSIGCPLRRKSPGHLCPRQGPTCFRTIHLHVQLAAPFWCDATDRFSPLKQPNNSLQHPLRWKTQSVAGFTKSYEQRGRADGFELEIAPKLKL